MTTENILNTTTLIDEWSNCQLRQGNDGFYMLSTTTGKHFIKSADYSERVQAHWSGFLINNGKKEFSRN